VESKSYLSELLFEAGSWCRYHYIHFDWLTSGKFSLQSYSVDMKLLFYPWLAPEAQDGSVVREKSQLTKLPQLGKM